MQIKVSEYFDGFNSFQKIQKTEKINLIDSLNRVISTNIQSAFDLPSFNNTAMDGYLFDISLPLSEYIDKDIIIRGSIFAGDDVKDGLRIGEVYKIMTGGKVPDCIKKPSVIPVEFVKETKENIVTFNKNILKEAWGSSNHIRLRGENLKKGEDIINCGDKITFPKIAILASQGLQEVEVFRQLKIGIFSTGSELATSKILDNNAKIFDINSPTIFNILKQHGFNSTIYPKLTDDIQEYKKGLGAALNNEDIIILSGGASVGEKDYTKLFLKEINANIYCEKLFLKPGKPTIVAKTNMGDKLDSQKVIINLPGNSQACLINLIMLILPLLRHIQSSNQTVQKVSANNKTHIKLANNITQNLLGHYDGKDFLVYNKGRINSSDIVAFSKCNAILSVEADSVAKDSLVDIILYEYN